MESVHDDSSEPEYDPVSLEDYLVFSNSSYF